MRRTEWTDDGKPILTAQLPLGSFWTAIGKSAVQKSGRRNFKGLRAFEKAEWSESNGRLNIFRRSRTTFGRL